MTIHSFHRVLRVRHVIRSISVAPGKTFRPRWPIPILELGYVAGLLLLFVAVSRLPVVGAVSHLPWGLWWAIPVWIVAATRMAKLDGRSPHAFAVTWVRYRRRPRRRLAGRRLALDGDRRRVKVRARGYFDEHTPRLHRGRVHGPATVRFAVPARMALARRGWVAHPGGEVTEYEVPERLEVRAR